MTFNKGQNIIPITALRDNIIWLWIKGKSVVVIDPAISKPIIKFIKEKDLVLDTIFQTHHHIDHIGGTEDLIREWPDVKVIASEKDKVRIPFQNLSVQNISSISQV